MAPSPSHTPPRAPKALPRALAVCACLAGAACASGTGGSAGTAGPPAAEAPADRADADDSARGAYAEADVSFMQGMIHHHAQAVVMARMAPTHDADPDVRRLAARILNSQKTEISVMSDWLRDRGETVPGHADIAREGGGTHGEAAHDGGGHGEGGEGAEVPAPAHLQGWDEGPQMPGVLSDARMAELHAARGEEFDRLFLTYMIDHHAGAVTMVDDLVEKPGAAREQSVFRLASGIRSDQEIEIDRMRQMLREQMFGPGSER